MLLEPDYVHSITDSGLSIVMLGLFVENGYWDSDTRLISPPQQE